jgi:DedD protein
VDEHLKKRLVGAIVLVALAVIFVPILLDDEVADTGITRTNIPPRPEAPFTSRIQPLEAEPAPRPVPLQAPPQSEAASRPMESSPQPAPEPQEPVSQPVETKAVAASAPAPVKPPVVESKPPAAAAPISSWVVQVGSFSSQENADKLVQELRAEKFPAFSVKAEVGGETLYRVRVGPEIDQKKAQQMQAGIEEKFKLKGRLEHYP